MEPIKFLHIADTHLGIRQYNLLERFKDFNRVFKQTLELAIENEVDFVLIAGDIFQSSTIAPETLSAVYSILNDFHESTQIQLNRNIPIICIEGNHDLSGSHQHLRTWLQFLNELGLIYLLREKYDNSKQTLTFTEYSSETRTGGMIRIKNAYIYGMRSYGSITPKYYPLLSQSIPEHPQGINILMMHIGIEGQDKSKFGVPISDELLNLHETIDYLALGHFHKQYILPREKPWIFNPGSLETIELEQVYDEKIQHGVFLTEIHEKDPSTWKITPIIAKSINQIDDLSQDSILTNRAFLSITINLSPEKRELELPNFQKALDYILEYLNVYLKPREDLGNISVYNLEVPIVHLFLKGTIPYSKFDVNTKEIERKVTEKFDTLKVKVHTRLESLLDGISISGEETPTVQQIEHEIFNLLVEQNPKYQPIQNEITNLMQDLKNGLLKKNPEPDELKKLIKDFSYSKNRSVIIDDEIPMKILDEIKEISGLSNIEDINEENLNLNLKETDSETNINKIKSTKKQTTLDSSTETFFEEIDEIEFDDEEDDEE
ncbi:MAG: metallophosphoesterase family protein [Promethearchaeota archaeon]